MAKIVKKMFCLPANSSPSGHVFSGAGKIVTKKCASLSGENIGELTFLHENKKLMIESISFGGNENCASVVVNFRASRFYFTNRIIGRNFAIYLLNVGIGFFVFASNLVITSLTTDRAHVANRFDKQISLAD